VVEANVANGYDPTTDESMGAPTSPRGGAAPGSNVRKKVARGVQKATGRMSDMYRQMGEDLRSNPTWARAHAQMDFRHGGRVPRTGIYRLHRGERVIPARGGRR
jgi:hypothetical protein